MINKTVRNVKSPLRIGNKVLIRTVTHYHVGRIVLLAADEVVLEDAAWIADTGRLHTALTMGTLDEVEPYPNLVSVGRGAIVDVTDWTHKLPLAQK